MVYDDDDNKSILTEDQIERAIAEVVAAAGPEGADNDLIFTAVDELKSMAVSAGLFQAWESGATVIGWDDEQQTLRFWIRGMQPFPLPGIGTVRE